ncbi:MAG: tetratricopeptide repeat protein [Labilithrix sp.]|nr:tetratricopeptide repeat protein [Labilithrix sp.]
MEAAETDGLRKQIERALRAGSFDPADVLPRLARLARLAPAASDDGVFAHQKLAELLVDRDPWRAALYVRRALAHRPDDDRAWATLAFCQTLLRNFRCATTAYKKAIASAPGNPWYAHNLGHIYDVALGEPARALPWLKAAYVAKPENSEIVASYAHALGRAGKLDDARTVVERARSRAPSRELDAVLRWLDQGAPARARADRPKRSSPRRLARELRRGLRHLPFDEDQKGRALALARDVGAGENVASVAAAVAYAIVYIDHVPLSQAEVAAPFRVGVAELRGVFAELRAKLDIPTQGLRPYSPSGT